MIQYKIAPNNWTPEDKNPFTENGLYGNEWSCFSTCGEFKYDFFTGRSKSGCWLIQFRKDNRNYQTRLADFLRYENANGRTVIIHFPDKERAEKIIKEAMTKTPLPGIRRDDDEEFLVHSTTMQSWEQIQSDGEIKAAAFLKSRWNFAGVSSEIDRYLENEPPEYKEYIMIGGMNSGNTELILASYKAKRFIFDENMEYEPGVRIYLRNYEIIADKLDVRDGVHTMKVHKQLPIEKYVAYAVSPKDLEKGTGIEKWTPKKFMERANSEFRRRNIIGKI